MKKILKIILSLLLLICVSQSNAQRPKTTRYTHGLHDYYFNSDGSYKETIDEMILSFPNQYTSQCIIDWGTYTKRRGHYFLNSSQQIDSMRISNIKSSNESKDSLIIDFSSPYEQIIKQNINYAIYTYNIQIICDSSLSGKNFEYDFNESHQFCLSGCLHVPKPKDVNIIEITIAIYPNHNFYKYYASFSSDPVLTIKYQSTNNDNHFCIDLPYFEYLTLTYRNRRAYQISKSLNWIICNGVVLKKYRPRFK